MKSFIYSVLLLIGVLFSSLSVNAQSGTGSSEELIRKGARLHDKGAYAEAITHYKKALDLNPASMSAVYEMSLSYLRMKDYTNSLKFSSKVIDANFAPLMVDAYAVKGTALSDMGRSNEAIMLFKEALKKCGDEYLLHFNLGLCYFNAKRNQLAIEHLRNAIEIDATHSSAFLLYAYALNDTGHWLQSFYSFHFFLLLEPSTGRSKDAFAEMYDMLMKNYQAGAPELTVDDGVDRRAIYESFMDKRPTLDTPAAQYKFYEEASRLIFYSMAQQQDDSRTSLMWYFFVPTYQEILNSGYFETYCKYVSVAYFDDSLKWWTNNKDEVDKFIAWFEHGADGGESGEEDLQPLEGLPASRK